MTAGDNLRGIYESAFEGCTSLKTVTIGSSLNHIGKDAFKGCTSLESFTSTSMEGIVYSYHEGTDDPERPAEYSFDTNTTVTFYGPHGSGLRAIPKDYKSSSFVPTDPHKNPPTWAWAEDFSSATATFDNCDDTCNGGTVTDNEIEREETEAGVTYTASVTVGGETYTDVKEIEISYWEELQERIDSASAGDTPTSIVLDHDVVASDGDTPLVIPAGKNIALVLQGKTINRNLTETVDDGNVFTNNGTLTLTGPGTVKGGKNNQNGGAIVNNGTLNLDGVTITGNTSQKDGGAIYNSGTLELISGEISSNSTGNNNSGSGGAISAHAGTITISGGVIKNNSAVSHGGAIYLGTSDSNSATLNLNGGTITGNTADKQGGGILHNGNLSVKGSPVVKNNIGGTGNNIYLRPNKLINVTSELSGDDNLGVTREDNAIGEITSGLPGNGSFETFFSDNAEYCIADNGSGEATLLQIASMDFDAQVFCHTLTLDGVIGVNTYLVLGDNITQNKDDYTVEFWNGSTLAFSKKVSEAKSTTKKKDGVGYIVYGFTVTTVAKEMDTEFTMRIKGPDGYVNFANSDGTAVDAETGLDYSINDYLDDRIAKSENEKMRQLAKDMKAYGIYAKHYFAVRDKGVSEQLPVIEGFNTVTESDLPDYTPPTSIDNFTYKGAALALEADTSFRMYFESEDPSGLTITATVDGSETTLVPKSRNGMYYVEVPNIVAKKLNDMYGFTIKNAEGETTNANHGPFGYVRWALSTTDKENLQYLMMALYHYNQSANAYFE